MANIRTPDPGLKLDLAGKTTYGDYLRLDRLLSAQEPRSKPEHHDELLFIIQHQTTELWLKLLVHELRSARALLATDELSPALKRLARVKHIQHTITDQWSVLATLTPSEYALIRPFLATSSGFQSAQYREVEFLLGNKHHDMVKVFLHDPEAHAALTTLLFQPSLYDEFLAHLARQGYAVPPECLDRDWSQPYVRNPDLVPVFKTIYDDPDRWWDAYEMAEKLVDVDEQFALWRFRHVKTVERIIGFKRGTGGSSGVPFLRKLVEMEFFPELWRVRTEIGPPTAC